MPTITKWLEHLAIMRRARKWAPCFRSGNNPPSKVLQITTEAPTWFLHLIDLQEVGWFEFQSVNSLQNSNRRFGSFKSAMFTSERNDGWNS